MRVSRIVRSKLLPWVMLGLLISLMILAGYVVDGYIPLGPFGEPDLVIMMFPIVVGIVMGMLAIRAWLLYITDFIYTNRGLVRVHSRDPIAIIDPLDYIRWAKIADMSQPARDALENMVVAKEGAAVVLEDRHIEEYLMPILRSWRDKQHLAYVSEEEYDRLVHGILPMEYREDGGNRAFGKRGSRSVGNAVLVTPVGMVRNYGADAICYTYIDNFWGLDIFGYSLTSDLTGERITFQGLPSYIIEAVLDHNPGFRLGDHMICHGTEPVPECVRAMVEAHQEVQGRELYKRPRWLWTFGVPEIPIDGTSRQEYVQDNIKDATKIRSGILDGFSEVKDAEDKLTASQQPALNPVPVDEKEDEKDGQ